MCEKEIELNEKYYINICGEEGNVVSDIVLKEEYWGEEIADLFAEGIPIIFDENGGWYLRESKMKWDNVKEAEETIIKYKEDVIMLAEEEIKKIMTEKTEYRIMIRYFYINENKKIRIKYPYIDEHGRIDMKKIEEVMEKAINRKPKIDLVECDYLSVKLTEFEAKKLSKYFEENEVFDKNENIEIIDDDHDCLIIFEK